MYYSCLDADCEDEHGQTMRVAVSDSPSGMFKQVKSSCRRFPLTRMRSKHRRGCICFTATTIMRRSARERLSSAISWQIHIPWRESRLPSCVRRSMKRFIRKTVSKKGQHWHTIEGAFYFYKEGTHYLMYSGACYQNPTYFIGYSIAHGPEDADLRTLPWTKYPDDHTYAPLFVQNKRDRRYGA